MSNNIGILDPDGSNPNPLNNEAYSEKYKELSAKWREFPAYENAQEIIDTIKAHQVILVTSGTGSGKTVLVPKFCLHALDYKAKIAVTLPKQMIAKSAAEFAAATLDVELGKDIGYQYRGSDKNHRSSDNKLLYATDGTIVARLMNDPLLKDFDAVIIDEAHERKVQIDFLLYLLRNVVRDRPEFKLIIMSATINVDIFKKYYSAYSFKYIDIGGQTNYPIESIFLDKNIPVNNYVEKGIETIKKIMDSSKDGDILFFVTSISETIGVCEKLEDVGEYCVEVYSGMDESKKKYAQEKDLYREISGKNRKIVIATNVAESSLTIDGIKYVIDAGLELSSYYNPDIRANVLEKQFITHAQAKQRMGRAGRTGPGICYHLYTKATFDKDMKRFPEPNIRTSNLYAEFINLLMIESVGNTDNLEKMLHDFIEPPENEYINESLNMLRELGLVKDKVLTPLGKIVYNLRMDPMEALTIYCAYHLNCVKEVIAIISMINTTKGNITALFNIPVDAAEEKDAKQSKFLMKKFDTAIEVFNNKYGDHLSLLQMFNTYLKKKESDELLKEWIYKYFLKRSTFEKAKINHRRYYSVYRRSNIEKIPIDGIMDYDISYRILASFMFGFRINLGSMSSKGISTDKVNNIDISKYSFVKSDTKKKKIVVYYELFKSNKLSMNIVSSIPKKSIELFEKFMTQLRSHKFPDK